MFEHEKYHDTASLAQLDDDELTRMADAGELGTADLVAARLQKYLNDPQSAPAPEPVANDASRDPYTVAVMKLLFPE